MRSWSFNTVSYVTVADRAASAKQHVTKSADKLSPVQVIATGNNIATTFWGKAWCENLESYRTYATRLPRGRSYVRAGAVVHLEILPGKIKAQVLGSTLYYIDITIANLSTGEWERLKESCAGQIESVIELLNGKFSQSVMEIITSKDNGFIPKAAEIQMSCTCPDHAVPCKHVAAAIYGVGVRLDANPQLLFELRQVDPTELITAVSSGMSVKPEMSDLDANLSEIFGIEIADVPLEVISPGKHARKIEPPPIVVSVKEVVPIDRKAPGLSEQFTKRYTPQPTLPPVKHQKGRKMGRDRGLLIFLRQISHDVYGRSSRSLLQGRYVSLTALKRLLKNPPPGYEIIPTDAALKKLTAKKKLPFETPTGAKKGAVLKTPAERSGVKKTEDVNLVVKPPMISKAAKTKAKVTHSTAVQPAKQVPKAKNPNGKEPSKMKLPENKKKGK